MRLLRLLVVGAATAAAAALAAGIYVLYNQTRLVELMLAQISERTGLKIVISSAHLAFHSHLIVILEKPRVLKDGGEVARLRQIRAVLSYHALVYRNGLPLYELSLY